MVHALIPIPSCRCDSITAIGDGKGNCYIFANGSGYKLLTDLFAICAELRKNEFMYLPLNFAYLGGYRAYFVDMPEAHYTGIGMVNYCDLQLSTKDMLSALNTKIYKTEKAGQVPHLPKKHIDPWKTKRRLTIKTQGKALIISTNGDGFIDLAQSCNRLTEYGDDAKCNDYSPHMHHDWKENTSKSAGLTFYYWQCPFL